MIGAGTAAALPGLPNLGATPPASRAQLAPSFTKATRGLPGAVGLAITPVGSDQTMSFGSIKTARAWSTLKVPVSIAAERVNGSRVAPDIRAAIRRSDNDAAERLWDSMRTERRAVDEVTAVLREGHDTGTHVASQADRPASYPGATQWTLARQSRFGAHLQCMPDARRVLGHMAVVESNQQWGVQTLKRRGVTTAVKGGWGPASDSTGKYVVRQLGVVTTPRGAFAVSMAALPTSGSFDDGTVMLNRVGTWIGANLSKFPVGAC
ncbi:hypothetical protein nbrc107696_12850 [Gordonia spumicola]|uniref:Serine hydrolase n=1 Tax=Gordonia spumicola TaxID=589161 RepID=A0A7I9V5Y9_9ACTN|nr:hypothetical protein [Gordonia spumicola]GEE00839.1 hypothetical protein nbrc107696_12850 [Gordonia spumicola]